MSRFFMVGCPTASTSGFLTGSSLPTGVYEIIPGFIASLLAAVAATLLDKEPSEEVTAIFDAATAPIEE